jgi:hypothetical protein
MQEMNTITDFTDYLSAKEDVFRSGKLTVAAGEEELVAYYATHVNEMRRHDFTDPDGKALGPSEHIALDVGIYDHLQTNQQYKARQKADIPSYVWDRLITQFTTNLMAGTNFVPEGLSSTLADIEEPLREMALLPRVLRRSLGEKILATLDKGATTDRAMASLVLMPSEPRHETGFVFMTFAYPKFPLAGGYADYREMRGKLLEITSMALLRRYSHLKRVVGIATEPRGPTRRSEDLMMVEAPEWTPEIIAELEEDQRIAKIMLDGAFNEERLTTIEYPTV